MTDLSGIGSNLTFTNGIPPKAPYYYITAHLDLSGVVVGNGITYYFNRDNNFNYLNPLSEEYHGFYQIDSNAVIGDVVLYSNPNLEEKSEFYYTVGGAILDPLVLDPTLADPVVAPWGGPTGFTADSVSSADINTGVVCFYGHEGGHLPDDLVNVNEARHLAISISTEPLTNQVNQVNGQEEELIVINEGDEEVIVINEEPSLDSLRASKRNAQDLKDAVKNGKVVKPEDHHELLGLLRAQKASSKSRAPRQVVDPDIASGTIYVVVKVYPKQTS